MTFGILKTQKTSSIRYVCMLILISLGSFLLIVNSADSQQPKETKRVFFLFSGQKDLPGQKLAEKGMRTALEQSMDFQFEYFIEYMDSFRFSDASFQQELLTFLLTKYADIKIDLFLLEGHNALEFAAAHGDDLFPQVPVVFSTVAEFQVKRLTLDNRFTGSLVQIDFLGLLNVALNCHPDIRHVVIIAGASNLGRSIERQARKLYAPYADKYNFIYPGHLPMSDMLDRLKRLPEHTVVLYLLLAKDGKGTAFKPWKVAAMVSEAANVPVYGLADNYLGTGIVGGTLLSVQASGRKAGEIGLRILKGENPADIPISAEGTILDMFDLRQLKRWGIHESDQPQGSIVRYKEWSFGDLYRRYVISGIFLLFFEGFIIFSLIVQRKRGNQTEQILRISDERFRAYLKNSMEAIWCVGLENHLSIDLSEDEQYGKILLQPV